ncbi:MAG: UDP-N-acetylmuramoyl-L-alanine--D-glutamate ligase [Deltaproteobacteria bacterium]|nr:UDP-N-acetylmuramoyl-L-alanine--D-glutamate ligase [Deltaproteobacteria bacterium]
MDIFGKKILVVGLARSGDAAARFCLGRGAVVTVADAASSPTLAERAEKLRALGITVVLGSQEDELFHAADIIVLSPGVPHTLAPIVEAKKRGALVMGEMELACRFVEADLIAVSGTNGKTTCTTLLSKMLEKTFANVLLGGNIGDPLIGYADRSEKADCAAVEVSSFQLDTIIDFHPLVSILLNVTDDHQDRYSGMKDYAASKERLFLNQTENDFAVLNGKDGYIREMAPRIKAKKFFFAGRRENEAGADIHRDRIEFFLPGGANWTLSLEKMSLAGEHNRENVAAAALGAYLAGAKAQGIQAALDEFTGLAHRLEFVAEINGVRYYDDSKGTNVDAVLRALEGFDEPLVLIMGGRDKASDFTVLRDMVQKKVKLLILAGEAGPVIGKALSGTTAIETAPNVPEAVRMAARAAKPGWVVLLSPGCASFDAYNSYAERGRDFCRAVRSLVQ